MSINRMIRVVTFAGVLLSLFIFSAVPAAAQVKLEAAKSIRCTFPLISNGTWTNGKPEASVKPASLVVEFESINTDEGTAQLKGGFGTYDIIVRFAAGYLHFIQAFRDGPLYTTTVLDKQSSGNKLKAVHSRHEYSDMSVPGFTSSPEQYYGDCEIMN